MRIQDCFLSTSLMFEKKMLRAKLHPFFWKTLVKLPSPAAGQMALQFQGTELGSPVLGLGPNIPKKFPSEAVGEMAQESDQLPRTSTFVVCASPHNAGFLSQRMESHWFFWILHKFNMI